jgi:hypothetical protein
MEMLWKKGLAKALKFVKFSPRLSHGPILPRARAKKFGSSLRAFSITPNPLRERRQDRIP